MFIVGDKSFFQGHSIRLLINSLFGVFYSYFWAGDSCFFQEFLQIYFVGLLLFLKDVSGTPIFKILVRTLPVLYVGYIF